MAASLSLASDILQRFPNVDLIYGADDTYGVGIARAVQATGKCGKVKVLFSVLGSAAEELMRAGCVDYVVAQQPALMGRIEIRLANDLIKGNKIEQPMVQVPVVIVTSEILIPSISVACEHQRVGHPSGLNRSVGELWTTRKHLLFVIPTGRQVACLHGTIW